MNPNLKKITNTKRQYRSAKDWELILEEYESSNLTQSEFCARNNLTLSNFYAWRKKLANGNQCDKPIDFFQIEAQPVEADIQAQIPQDTSPLWNLEIDLGEGRCLRMRFA